MTLERQSSQGWSLWVDLGAGLVEVEGVMDIDPPHPKPTRQDTPGLASTFVEKTNIGLPDPGEVSATLYTNTADATHLALRNLLNTPDSYDWEIRDDEGTPIDSFEGTLIDFPRKVQQGKVLQGSLTISLDSLPTNANS